MDQTGQHRIFVQAENVQTREIDDEFFLIDASGGTIHSLDPIGAAVWEAFQQATRLCDVMEELVSAFPDTDRGQIEADLDMLVNDLCDYDLLKRVDASAND